MQAPSRYLQYRKHPLFISSNVSVAANVSPVEGNRPSSGHTGAGLIDWPTGSMGDMNFGAPCRLRAKAGFARWWGLQIPQTVTIGSPGQSDPESSRFSMLALRPRKPEEQQCTVNGVICMAYSDEELAAARAFYQSFKNASLRRLAISEFEAISWASLPECDWVYCVVCNDAAFRPPSFNSPILQSYLHDVCMGFKAHGSDFMQEFLETTMGWSTYWIDDQPRLFDYSDPSMDDRLGLRWQLEKVLPFADALKNIATYPAHKHDSELDPWPRTTVKSGPIQAKGVQYFTFGMGSLINTPSRVGTAGVAAQSAIPVRISGEYAFCPCWNFQNYAGGSQLTAGGMVLRSDPRIKNKEAETVGVIYPCPGDDAAMAAQDEREIGYTRFNIPNEFIHPLDHWQKVFQYVPNTELPDDHPQRERGPDGSLTPRAPFPPREYPLSQTYVDTCILGCLEYSRKMACKWIQGFIGWPTSDSPHWINDRVLPRQPWCQMPLFETIDTILAEMLPDSFVHRALPAEYGSHYWSGEGCARASCTRRDVRYTSYSECSRDEVQAARREAPFFIFETGLLMPRQNFSAMKRFMFKDHTPAEGIPCRLSKEAGLRRTHGMIHDGILPSTACALADAAPDGEPRDVVGILYPAPNGWAASSGEPREPEDDWRLEFYNAKHHRVEVQCEQITVLRAWTHVPEGARIFAYVCSAPQPPSFHHPISQQILDMLLGECLQSHGEDLCQEYVDTTDTWVLPDGSAYFLNDRNLPRRPWVHLGGKYKIFDRIIMESRSPHIPRGTLKKRCLIEEYSALDPMEETATSVEEAFRPAAGPAMNAVRKKPNVI
eukprot:CAMPEP_0117612670 /NCGR_PEP_ID=MMETSP0784-20121206/83066_1 /TAXON_ID=39447 /ORGANISM="" /LENGTH=828 /DNA_ID=CAMNT_0005416227 /DNA_START=273 /DNA_END=2759 /DNA_ORIENTATION=-